MRTSNVLLFLLLFAASQLCVAGPFGGAVTVRVRVVDQDGRAVEGAKVGISFPNITGNKYVSGDGYTDRRGIYEFRGRAYKYVYYTIGKEGYYFANGEENLYTKDREGVRMLDELEIQVPAKEIRNPIVMISDGFFRLLVPEFGKELGYDFFRNDWVAPYGEGEHSDVLFEVDGYFNSERDRKSTLVARFPNPGDGMVAFEADLDQDSALKSDHLAPGEGYESEWNWNISVREDPKMNRGIFERDYTEDRGYYLRLRTAYDEAGNIVSCHYGKIYGDFRFDGVWPRDSSIVCEAYYVNPNPNDRNVEARTGETLIPEPGLLDPPRLP